MCLEERVSVAETLMKLGDRHLGGERLELRSLKQVLIGPWGRNQEERIQLGYKTAGLAVEICTNQTPLTFFCFHDAIPFFFPDNIIHISQKRGRCKRKLIFMKLSL